MLHELTIDPPDHELYASFSIAPSAGSQVPRVWLSLAASGDMWGNGKAEENRTSFYRAVGIPSDAVRTVKQVHSRRVVPADECGQEEAADGLIAKGPQVALGVRVADCFPIFLYDARTGGFAALHSGWKGTGILLEALRLMSSQYGTRAPDVHALLGPGIRSCCYNVPDERAQAFEREFGPNAVVRRGEERYLDLASANISLLESAGVGEITAVTNCTSCSPFLGSFRREGPENFTHMLAVIAYMR